MAISNNGLATATESLCGAHEAQHYREGWLGTGEWGQIDYWLLHRAPTSSGGNYIGVAGYISLEGTNFQREANRKALGAAELRQLGTLADAVYNRLMK